MWPWGGQWGQASKPGHPGHPCLIPMGTPGPTLPPLGSCHGSQPPRSQAGGTLRRGQRPASRLLGGGSPLGIFCWDEPPSALREAVLSSGRAWLRGSLRLPLGVNGAPSRVEELGTNPGDGASSGATAHIIMVWDPLCPVGTRHAEEPESGLGTEVPTDCASPCY